jgi:hypothetical protein
MNKFCGACGAPIHEGAAFCGSCGASTQQASSPAPQAEHQPVVPPAAVAPTPQPEFQPVAAQPIPTPAPASAAKSSSPWIKIAIVVVLIIFAVGAMAVGGVIYVAHKVSQKAQEYKREVLGESPAPGGAASEAPGTGGVQPAAATADEKSPAVTGDACRLLSKDDVSSAIGVTIVETQASDNGCSYLAKGTATDMVAKHTAAMIGAKGADKKTQGMVEQFARVIGDSAPKEETKGTETADGNVVVLSFSIESNSGREEMHLNAKVLGGLGPAQQALDNIGDEAFAEADAMMFVRKGDRLIRIMYSSCPCITDAIKPLAKEIVANL